MPSVHHEPPTGLADDGETIASLWSGQGLAPEPGQPEAGPWLLGEV